ncbi:MAG: hypothetical protein LBN26_03725 [Christensenellaceae bacterium]|jgi:hypothetical protein|nr:hypothetical protein [Christensenellaceae bacterium]
MKSTDSGFLRSLHLLNVDLDAVGQPIDSFFASDYHYVGWASYTKAFRDENPNSALDADLKALYDIITADDIAAASRRFIQNISKLGPKGPSMHYNSFLRCIADKLKNWPGIDENAGALMLLAFCYAQAHENEEANISLLQVLKLEQAGKLSSIHMAWVPLARVTGFETWYRRKLDL